MIHRDKKILWHPYTQHGLEPDLLEILSAHGAWLQLSNGQKILDAISSWWVNVHGHTHPTIIDAIYQQAQQLDHVIFAGCTHEPAIQLAELLINAAQNSQSNLRFCFYSDNGSTAIEAAIKMAYQYHQNNGAKTRTRFISLQNAYHGETIGCVSMNDRHGFSKIFTHLLFQVDFVPTDNIEILKNLLSTQSEKYAAIIVEPLIQSVNGMKIYAKQYLFELAKLCQEHNILLICDEVFTGFYRTGTCFAFEQANIKPDILCLGKSLTGGVLPLAATLVSADVYNAFYATEVERGFIHGHSYSANPIACAAAIASWNLLQLPETQSAIQRITQCTKNNIARLSLHPHVFNPRALGTIGALNVPSISNYFSQISYKIRKLALEQNILLRPLGPVIYTVPPYCVSDEDLDNVYNCIEYILNNLEN